MKLFFCTKERMRCNRGFTLVELLVVIFVVSVMTSIAVIRYRGFDDDVALNNQALEVALTIKEAQTNAIASKSSSVDSTVFKEAHGVYFDKTIDATAFVTYINRNDADPATNYWFNDGNYDHCGDPSYECLKKYTLNPGYTILQVCTPNIGNACTGNRGSVSFQRPDPAGIIRKEDSTTLRTQMKIVIQSPKMATSSVYITKTGLIYVK